MPARPPASLPQQSVSPADHTHARAQPLSVDTGAFASTVYGTTTVAIDPDDAAAAGTSAKVSREDHAHEWLTAVPSSLAKTATNAEGSSGDGARADHQHATSVMPWGLVARQVLTADEAAAHTASGTSDFTLSPTVDVLRAYRVHLETQVLFSAAAQWTIEFRVATVVTGRFDNFQSAGALRWWLSSSFLWLPASGTPTIDVSVVEVGAGGDLTFEAAAGRQRAFWVEDIGLR